MKIHSPILSTFLLVIIAGNVHAASFDCGKAASEVEKLICEDQALSKSDETLAALYAETLKQAADPLLVKRQQRAWLRNGRHCIDVSCLRKAYAKRLKALSSVLGTMSRRTAKTIKSDREACQVVADFANKGILDNLSVPPEASQPTTEELERIFGKDPLETLYGGLSYWRVDLDNDGIPDHLLIVVDGTAHVSDAYVLSGKKGSSVLGIGADEYDLSVLKVGGRYYVLSHYGRRLGKLWRLSGGGPVVPVCKFTQRRESRVELVAGKENAVCSEASLGRIRHIVYSLMHALDPLPESHHSPVDGLAQVDINNDRTPDNVVRIDFSRPGGRGCEGSYIAVTDETRTKIPDTKLNKILSGKARCDSYVDVFVHEGTTYLDVQDNSGNREIYRITGDKIETICEFRCQLLYDVVDVVEESEE